MEPFDKPLETIQLKRIFLQIGGVIAIAAILGLFILAYQGTYRTVETLDRRAGERWVAVTRDLQERYAGIPELSADLGPSLSPDDPSLTRVSRDLDLWEAAMSEGTMEDISRATTDLEESLLSLEEVLEESPSLAASGEAGEFLSALEATGERVSADRESYNEGSGEYNRALGSFPANLWTDNWRFSRREYFTAKIDGEEPPPVPAD